MNKAELVIRIAEQIGFSRSDTERMVKAFTSTVADCLKNNDNLSIFGFGSFSVVKRKARTGHNPKTGTEITIMAKRSPKFTPGKALKAAVK